MGGLAVAGSGFITGSVIHHHMTFRAPNGLLSAPPSRPIQKPGAERYDIAVIGGGVVGLACCREAAVAGYSVVLLEAETSVAAGASSGNSGLGCTGYDAPVGSLERHLLRRAIQRHPAIYRSFGLSYDHVRKCGSLVVAWGDDQMKELKQILQDNIDAGDTEARCLSRLELAEIGGPGLSKEAHGAVLCPREAVVEPWLIPIGYAESAMLHGASIRLGTEVMGARRIQPAQSSGTNGWRLNARKSDKASVGRSLEGSLYVPKPANEIEPSDVQGSQQEFEIEAKVVINCAGLYGDVVEQFRIDGRQEIVDQHSKPWFSITPRKGQFVVFKPRKEDIDDLPMHIIEPVPTEFTKGVIVWVTPYGNVVVGPTAVNQESRTDRSTDETTFDMLEKWGEQVMPSLKNAKVLGTYSGLRPSTEYRDYQIVAHNKENWITVGGIRSTGLTASSGIAEYVADMCNELLPSPNPASGSFIPWTNEGIDNPQLPGVTEAAMNPDALDSRVKHRNDIVPPLDELAKQFQARKQAKGNEQIEIYGKQWRVTHPISLFGMESTNLDGH